MNQFPSMTRATIRQRWRFAMVLAASLLLAVAQPLTSGLFGEEGSFDVFFSLLIGAVMLLVLEEREHRITAISLGLDCHSWHLDWLRHGRLGRPSAPRGIALARGLRLCVCLVRNSPCSSRESSVGGRDLWRGLRLSALGNHLGACLLRRGDGLARIVHFIRLVENTNGCRTARPRHPQLLQLHYLGHGGVWRRDADPRPWPGRWPGSRPLLVSSTLRSWWRDL